MCVSVVVTIRQCAESLSVRVGADHFLVSHHPGGGVIHLGMEEQTVKDTDTKTEYQITRARLILLIYFYIYLFKVELQSTCLLCWYYACLHFFYILVHLWRCYYCSQVITSEYHLEWIFFHNHSALHNYSVT